MGQLVTLWDTIKLKITYKMYILTHRLGRNPIPSDSDSSDSDSNTELETDSETETGSEDED